LTGSNRSTTIGYAIAIAVLQKRKTKLLNGSVERLLMDARQGSQGTVVMRQRIRFDSKCKHALYI